MKFHLLIISIIIVNSSLAYQNRFDYVDYNKEIRNAEENILDGYFDSAIISYAKVFENYDFVFLQHCYTATQTAIFIGDTVKASDFFKRGIKQGMKLEMAYRDSLLSQLTKSTYWESIEIEFDSLRAIYLSHIDTNLRSKINSLYALDRKYRDKHELHPWNFLWRPLIWSKWKKVTKTIVEDELMEIIKVHGYPGERLIGVDESGMFVTKNEDSFGSFFATTILIHYYSVPRDTALNPILRNEINRGNILPEHYATFVDFQAEFGKSKYYKGLHYNQWHEDDSEGNLDQINQNRVEIGLEHLESLNIKKDRGLKACRGQLSNSIKLWHFCG